MRTAPVAGIIAALSAPSALAAAPLEASGAWHLDYEATQCVASRNYGTESKPLILSLIPSVTGAAMRILFIRDGRATQRQEPARLALGKDKPIDTFSFIYDVPDKNHRVIVINVPMTQVRAAASSEMIGLESDALTADFAANSLPAVLTALDACLVDLQKAWNMETPLHRPETAQDMPTVFTAADYPPAAQYRGLSGHVRVSILIDETGKVADCTVDEPSGVGILDVATCYVIQKRAKFTPARDGKGNAVRSAVAQDVRWQLTP